MPQRTWVRIQVRRVLTSGPNQRPPIQLMPQEKQMLIGKWKDLTLAEKFYEVVAIGWIGAFAFFVYAHIKLALGP